MVPRACNTRFLKIVFDLADMSVYVKIFHVDSMFAKFFSQSGSVGSASDEIFSANAKFILK
jgi:hypothetical protein